MLAARARIWRRLAGNPFQPSAVSVQLRDEVDGLVLLDKQYRSHLPR